MPDSKTHLFPLFHILITVTMQSILIMTDEEFFRARTKYVCEGNLDEASVICREDPWMASPSCFGTPFCPQCSIDPLRNLPQVQSRKHFKREKNQPL